MTDLEPLRDRLMAAVAEAADLDQLEAVRLQSLGRKGEITERMKTLGGLAPDARRAAGQQLNELKDAVAEALEARRAALQADALDRRLAADRIDVTLPPRPAAEGRIHPISQTIDELTAIFADMGFTVAEGPHIEEDFYNFTALNIPPEHPARQEHDTFYLPPRADGTRLVLRTHTSPVQIRTMMRDKPPIRIIVPGRTFRSDHDATHSPMFHQVEGWSSTARATWATSRAASSSSAAPSSTSTTCRCASGRATSLHGALGGGRYRLLAPGRPAPDRPRRRLAGDSRLRHGPSEGSRQRRRRPG